jgi:hypothetical protein
MPVCRPIIRPAHDEHDGISFPFLIIHFGTCGMMGITRLVRLFAGRHMESSMTDAANPTQPSNGHVPLIVYMFLTGGAW